MCIFAAAAAGGAAAGAAATAASMGGIMTAMQVGMSALGSLMAFQGQQAQHKAALRHRQEQAIQAQKTLNQQVAQQQTQYESELNRGQQEKFKVARGALIASSRADASAAESGIVGLSVDNLLGEISMRRDEFGAEVDQGAETLWHTTNNQLKMARRSGEARLASIPIPTAPSIGPTLVNIGSSFLGGMQRQFKTTQRTRGVTLS